MYAITLSKTAGQSLWRNNKNIKFYKLVLVIHKQLISFLNKHMLLFQYQYGFRESHSTTLALIEIIDDIKSKLDKYGEYVIGAYLDLK